MDELLINEPFASVLVQEIVKKKRGRTIFLISKALSLIFCVAFLIEAVTPLISGAHLEVREAARKVSFVAELIRKAP